MNTTKQAPVTLIILAFAAVYIIWGSTYFFIERAVRHFPPMVIGSVRFAAAAIIMMVWVKLRGEKLWNKEAIKYSLISGVLMLFIGNGAVIWAEQHLQSSFVAIFLASAPIWFLAFDKPQWKQNFSNKFTLLGILAGLVGVMLLFFEKIQNHELGLSLLPLIVITIGNAGWTLGSLVSKYKVKNISPSVNSAWQMASAAIAFSVVGIADKSFSETNWSTVPTEGWFSLGYLIIFGSIIGFSAYVYLLAHRNPTQVSSYAYVNPLVAVILGVFLNGETITPMQYAGLAVILGSVLFINIAKGRKSKQAEKQIESLSNAKSLSADVVS